MARKDNIKAAQDYEDSLIYASVSEQCDVQKAFITGANWRINSAWHSTDELPKRSGFLAVLIDNGIMETMYYSVGIGSHEMTLKGYTSWAYVYDLLPERKEEAK